MEKLSQKEVGIFNDFRRSISDITNHSRLYDIFKQIRFDLINSQENRTLNINKLQLVKKLIEELDLSEEDLEKIDKRYKDYGYKSYPDQNNPKFTEYISNKMEFAYNKNDLVLFPEMNCYSETPEITTDCWDILNTRAF